MRDCLLINGLLQPNAATSAETIATAADGFKPDNATLDVLSVGTGIVILN
jgi:hypothetical protein